MKCLRIVFYFLLCLGNPYYLFEFWFSKSKEFTLKSQYSMLNSDPFKLFPKPFSLPLCSNNFKAPFLNSVLLLLLRFWRTTKLDSFLKSHCYGCNLRISQTWQHSFGHHYRSLSLQTTEDNANTHFTHSVNTLCKHKHSKVVPQPFKTFGRQGIFSFGCHLPKVRFLTPSPPSPHIVVVGFTVEWNWKEWNKKQLRLSLITSSKMAWWMVTTARQTVSVFVHDQHSYFLLYVKTLVQRKFELNDTK